MLCVAEEDQILWGQWTYLPNGKPTENIMGQYYSEFDYHIKVIIFY